MQPMDRKELGALVDAGRERWRSMVGRDEGMNEAIVAVIWEKMTETRIGHNNGADIQLGYRCSGETCRVLICTDTPAPTLEEDGLWIARLIVDAGEAAIAPALLAAAQRILKEADCD